MLPEDESFDKRSEATARTISQTFSVDERDPPHLRREDDAEGDPEEYYDPLDVVRMFCELLECRAFDRAASLLDDNVQASIPGLPFIASAKDWRKLACNARNQADPVVWQPLQRGAHSRQVVRRGRSRRQGAVIEVYEVNDVPSPSRDVPRISTIYLRKAPRRWAPGMGESPSRLRRKQNKMKKRCMEERMEPEDLMHIEDVHAAEDNFLFRLQRGNFILEAEDEEQDT